jgi:molybdate transport system substrate-binding protein
MKARRTDGVDHFRLSGWCCTPPAGVTLRLLYTPGTPMPISIRTFLSALSISFGTLLMPLDPAHADLTIYSGGAVKSGLTEAVERFQKEKGIKIELNFMPMGPLAKKMDEGLAADIVVLSEDRVPAASASGKIDKDTIVEVGRVAIGVAVNEKAPAPDISTPEAFKQALLAAKSIVYIDPARGTSGAHIAKVLEQLGIADEVKGKTTLGESGHVVEPVGKGEIELGIHQITEILPVKGIKLVGPLPSALQKETVYQGAMMSGSAHKAEAASFLKFVRSQEIRDIFKAKGFLE